MHLLCVNQLRVLSNGNGNVKDAARTWIPDKDGRHLGALPVLIRDQ